MGSCRRLSEARWVEGVVLVGRAAGGRICAASRMRMRNNWPEGPGTAGAEGGGGRWSWEQRRGFACRGKDTGKDRRAEAGLSRCASRKGEGVRRGYVGGGGREVRDASWMKQARLKRMERVSPVRVALAELFKPK